MNTRLSPASRGFTLIELLTVIAIIGILAAILIPTVGRVRAAAKSSTDLSNLRQIGQACAMYVADNKNTMPWSLDKNGNFQAGEANTSASGGSPGSRYPIYESIDRYFTKKPGFVVSGQYQWKFRQTWFSAIAEIPDGVTKTNAPFGEYAHFSFNPFIWSDRANGTGVATGEWKARMTTIPSPSRTVLMAETNDPAGVGNQDLDPSIEPITENNKEGRYRVSQPGNKAYYLWADFHVTSLAGNQNFTANPSIWKWWGLPASP